MIDNDPPLPAQEKDPLRAIGRLHAAHAEDASRSQSLVERITRGAGTPAFIGLLAVGAYCGSASTSLSSRRQS